MSMYRPHWMSSSPASSFDQPHAHQHQSGAATATSSVAHHHGHQVSRKILKTRQENNVDLFFPKSGAWNTPSRLSPPPPASSGYSSSTLPPTPPKDLTSPHESTTTTGQSPSSSPQPLVVPKQEFPNHISHHHVDEHSRGSLANRDSKTPNYYHPGLRNFQ